MKAHEKGWKATRDRAQIVSNYARVTKFFKIKRISDLELSRLGNESLYKLGNDIWDSQPRAKRARFMEKFYAIGNPQYRLNPRRFKWAYIDARKAHNWFFALFVAVSIKRYNRNVAKAAEAKTDEKPAAIKFPEAEAKA